ncbi:MAG TPA: nicotinate-nucleotide adenylyltransferase [Nitrospirales bacterium]
MKLGLYGGAFNPVHRCHLIVADAAYRRLGLDAVLFIPTGDPPHKPFSELIPSAYRLEMLKLAIAPYPYFQVSDIETRRPTKSYSIETIREIQQRYPPDTELVFIIGLDAFLDLPTWREPEALLSTCDFAVVARSGCTFASLDELPFFEGQNKADLAKIDAGARDLAKVPLKSGRALWVIRIPPCEVSGKEIRSRLRNGGDLENFLPADVESYIRRMDLH